jgi:hypothetical protein
MKKLRELLRANRWFAVVLLLEAAVLAWQHRCSAHPTNCS